MNRDLGLVPLINFGRVVAKSTGIIYRSAQPEYAYQYNWLANNMNKLKLVNLRSEAEIDRRYATFPHLQYKQIPVVDHQPPTIEQAVEFMEDVRDYKGDMLIHCAHGHGRTSTFSVLAKVALGWTLQEAMEDEHKRFHYEFRHHAQEEWLYDHITNLWRYSKLS